MNRIYKNINSDSFNNGIYSLVPIRDEDKYDIMNWRNNQLDILRQETVLLIEQQEIYFKTVVDKLFDTRNVNNKENAIKTKGVILSLSFLLLSNAL
jgi:hypothetical protein